MKTEVVIRCAIQYFTDVIAFDERFVVTSLLTISSSRLIFRVRLRRASPPMPPKRDATFRDNSAVVRWREFECRRQ